MASGEQPVAQHSPTLSLCMIVRDAERSLPAALASTRPFVDEIVVVDTGSVDGTRRIAKEHGARVFDFAWCDDFSAARNYSLDQATGDWIFWMDADDVLPAESGAELRRLIAACQPPSAAYLVRIVEQPAAGGSEPPRAQHAHAKLFPRHPAIRFRYRIHEQVSPAIRQAGFPIRDSSLVIQHFPDRSPPADERRRERNLRLAYLDLKDRPDDALVWLNLGTTYLHLTDCLATAVYYLRRSVDGLPRGSTLQLKALLHLGQALVDSRDPRQAEQLYRQALQLFPNETALLLRLSGLEAASGRFTAAAAGYQSILSGGHSRLATASVQDDRTRGALRLGQLYVRTGKPERAVQLWRDYLASNPGAAIIAQALENLAAGVGPSSRVSNP